jgi:L-arabinose isomerase
LYIKLYDQTMPNLRPRVEHIRDMAAEELRKRGLEVIVAPVCRVKADVQAAVKLFEDHGADAVVTVHLAYSPSMESVRALAGTRLPLIIFDTTPAYDFSEQQDPDEILYNHGIHGVQDLCSRLKREGKSFFIEAGHITDSDVADRVASRVKSFGKASELAAAMRGSRIGIIGKPFKGMGDFQVADEVMQARIGIRVVKYDDEKSALYYAMIQDDEIAAEMAQDLQRFDLGSLSRETHEASTRVNLAVRKWIENEGLSGFSVNFLNIGKKSGISRMPYLEAGKAMSRGIGYAGEGDILTAAFIGSLMKKFPDVSFTEMFCPDWCNESIFLSHSGEMNISLTAGKPLLTETGFSHTDAGSSAVAYGCYRPGQAVFASLSPGSDHSFSLIYRTGAMKQISGTDRMQNTVHGWFDPGMPVSDFLEKYSRAGGIHHGAIIYGDAAETLEAFGGLMGWDVIRI